MAWGPQHIRPPDLPRRLRLHHPPVPLCRRGPMALMLGQASRGPCCGAPTTQYIGCSKVYPSLSSTLPMPQVRKLPCAVGSMHHGLPFRLQASCQAMQSSASPTKPTALQHALTGQAGQGGELPCPFVSHSPHSASEAPLRGRLKGHASASRGLRRRQAQGRAHPQAGALCSASPGWSALQCFPLRGTRPQRRAGGRSSPPSAPAAAAVIGT
jgi:hypothetical protein